MAIAWECFPLAGFRSVWRKTCLSACWQPAISWIPHHIGFSKTSFENARRTVPAGVTAGVRDGSAEVGTSGFGWEQSKSQREQAQGHELWTDGGDREAAAEGSARVVEASRGRG